MWDGQPRWQRYRGGIGELSLIRPVFLLVFGATYENNRREKYEGYADHVDADIDLQACGVSGSEHSAGYSNKPTVLLWYAPYWSLVRVLIVHASKAETYEAQLLLEVERHGFGCACLIDYRCGRADDIAWARRDQARAAVSVQPAGKGRAAAACGAWWWAS